MQRVIDERCAGPRPPGDAGRLDGATGARGAGPPDDADALALTSTQAVAPVEGGAAGTDRRRFLSRRRGGMDGRVIGEDEPRRH